MSNALDETYLYYRDLDKGSSQNLEREALLVKYWSAAAIPMRHFDETLSSICEHKSQYWVDPTNYTQEDIKEMEIGLDNVRQAYRKMLSHLPFQNETNYHCNCKQFMGHFNQGLQENKLN